MKLNEWNELIEYGNELCNDLKEKGYDVRLTPYTLYDGRRGFIMQVLDSVGGVFKEYYSGFGEFEMVKASISVNARKIFTEC